ncbi:MAG: tyrosine--tRNA ligase [Bacteroidales bacterium]|nr:tyrosine--tRNA ligase [Bacteroidales bacterium]
MTNFVEELKWRGMIHDIMPGTEEQLKNELTTGYIGFDPTADSLHIGSLVQIMILVHLQKSGHKPIAVVGGATGMVGDPSGKSAERNLLTREIIEKNLCGIKSQLEKFLDFNAGPNSAEIIDNYSWFKDYSFLDFIRDVGKHITVNYMLAKDSVQKRLEFGMSFTEFSYQLIQGYDFYWLYKNKNAKLQLGGSDQWGNIVTGTELIRRMAGGSAFAVTSPLIKKADGTKFGKTEEGNVWLDRKLTSPYKFYQYWINTSDEDAENYIKIFTLKTKAEIDSIIEEHKQAPHLRLLQKELAKDITIRVHSEADYNSAIEASEILFGKGTAETLAKMDEETFLSVFEGVPVYEISLSEIEKGINITELLTDKTGAFPSKGEFRRTLQGGGVNLNKEKMNDGDMIVNNSHLLNGKFLLGQKGKKSYFLIRVS